MMTRSTRFLTAALMGLSLVSGAIAADDAKPAGPLTVERQMEMLTEALTLTPEQVEKIKPLVERDREKAVALREDKSVSLEDRRTKFREMARSRMEEIRALLTPEQQEKFKTVMEERRAQFEKRRAEREKQAESK